INVIDLSTLSISVPLEPLPVPGIILILSFGFYFSVTEVKFPFSGLNSFEVISFSKKLPIVVVMLPASRTATLLDLPFHRNALVLEENFERDIFNGLRIVDILRRKNPGKAIYLLFQLEFPGEF